MSMTFEASKAGYHNLWLAMNVDQSKQAAVNATAQKIIASKARYKAVEAKTGVPWFFIGCLHSLEASCNFDCHLHNGDALTARTHNVPAGRPLVGNSPFTWEASAVDALTMRGLKSVLNWTIERMLYEAEAYNGWGYERRGINSPYDWAGSDNYDRGKFVSDGVFSATARSQQLGVGPLLAALSSLDTSVRLYSEVDTLPAPRVLQHHGFRWLIVSGIAYVGNLFHTTVGNVAQFTTGLDFNDVRANVNDTISTGQEVAGWFGYEAKTLVPFLVAVGVCMAFYHFYKTERVN